MKAGNGAVRQDAVTWKWPEAVCSEPCLIRERTSGPPINRSIMGKQG